MMAGMARCRTKKGQAMDFPNDVEDLQQAYEAGRPVRAHGPYRVLLGDELLNYRPTVIEDPVSTGRQLLEAAGVQPIQEHSVFQVLRNGQLEGLRFDETTDLRSREVEKFLIFRSDRSFRFELDGSIFEWGADRVQGRVLKTLAKVDLVTYGVWQEVPEQDDRAIGDEQFANLAPQGVERFFTGIVKTTEGH
jgi:hypothetical protein